MSMVLDERVMRALANNERRKILEYLINTDASSYSEIMKALGYNIGNSSRFAYHLKKLINAGLVKQLPNGKYTLTPKGKNIANILREEESEYPTIIDTLSQFSRLINIREFMSGCILVYVGLSFTVLGGILTPMSIVGIPAKFEILGTIHYYIPNTTVSVMSLIIGLIILTMGINLLKHTVPGASILELLIYQKYSFLLLSRSRRLNKYLIMYILATIAWLSILIIAMF